MASKRDPSFGLATVYRMVAVLEEMGFLRKGYRYYYPGSKRGEEKEVF